MVQIDNNQETAAPTLRRREADWRVADLLVDVLVGHGVDVVFGVPGGAIAPIYDALLDRPEIRVVATRGEAGAMFAAAGYARTTGKPGVVLVTSGPGALNCMTGLASALCDGLPVVLIAGEVPRALFGKGALQEGSANLLNVVGMARHVTKMAYEVTQPKSATMVLRRAIATALSGRQGPVLVSLPLDVVSATTKRPGITSRVELTTVVEPAVLAKIAATLSESERALIFVGSGARWGDGPRRVRQLAERLQIPVITTQKGKGVFPESHPLSLGVFGHGGHPSASAYLEKGIDVLLAVGTGFSDPATDGWSPLLEPKRHLIQVDIDALQIGRNYEVSVGVVGKAGDVLAGILKHLPNAPQPRREFGIRYHTDPASMAHGPEGLLPPQRALWELQQWLPPDTLYTCDIGAHLLFATHYLRVDHPLGFGIMTGLASMGSGIAAALGTKLARPKHTVCAVVGDGCFGVGIGDLATAARECIPLVVAVLNDGRYAMVELGHTALFGRTPSFPCDDLSIRRVAASVGVDTVLVEHAGQIASLGREALEGSMPLVLDIRIDKCVTMPRAKRFEELKRSIPPRRGLKRVGTARTTSTEAA